VPRLGQDQGGFLYGRTVVNPGNMR
jgi:hypothetical protein